MTYNQFREKWNLDTPEISSKQCVDIKMAIRQFKCPTIASRDILQIDTDTCLSFFKTSTGFYQKLIEWQTNS